jgi:hypothetical protein
MTRGKQILFLAFVITLSLAAKSAAQDVPQKTTVCELIQNPKSFDHKLVVVTGFASHGFEDSGFSDPACGGRYGGLWMEFGGEASTGTMSTVSDLSRTRPESAVVEGVSVPLIEDRNFQTFDKLLHQGNGNLVRATVIARFFAGRENFDGIKGFSGYGHLGCCSLFMIQQVLSLDENRDPNLDYTGEPTQPTKASCYRFLTPVDNQSAELRAQKAAESGERGYAFTDPDHVAREEVAMRAKTSDIGSVRLTRLNATPARIAYEASIPKSKTRYTVTLSRPYWLSVQAADPTKVAWVVLASIATCDASGEGGSVQRLQ